MIRRLNQFIQSWRFTLRLIERAITLRRRTAKQKSLATIAEVIITSDHFHSHQKVSEISQLLELLRDAQSRFVCEIGTRYGGTLFLFCQVLARNARILSIDLDYPSIEYKRCYSLLQRYGQKLMCIQADSHNYSTLHTTRQWFENSQLDFLFIDGDHSLTGVRLDFEMFAPLVRPGGIIAFHDIWPFHSALTGEPIINNTCQVPQFWADLKQQGYQTIEFIENPNQDSFGIGVLFWPGEFLQPYSGMSSP